MHAHFESGLVKLVHGTIEPVTPRVALRDPARSLVAIVVTVGLLVGAVAPASATSASATADSVGTSTLAAAQIVGPGTNVFTPKSQYAYGSLALTGVDVGAVSRGAPCFIVVETRSVTDASGAVVAEFDYSLYGTVATVSGDAGATRFLFAGEYLDPSGDYYLRNRVYDPASASFLSVDPALAATGMPYAYTPGNPLQMIDPLGLYSWDDFTDDVGGAAGAVWDEVSSPEFIASMAVGIGCTILTGGTAIVGCAAWAGGVYNATAYLANTPPEVHDGAGVLPDDGGGRACWRGDRVCLWAGRFPRGGGREVWSQQDRAGVPEAVGE